MTDEALDRCLAGRYALREGNKMTDKNTAAVELGKLGNIARNKKLSPERRSEIARNAALARWAKRDEQERNHNA